MNSYRGSLFSTFVLTLASLVSAADEPPLSGPQVGEKAAAFKVEGVFDDDAGKPLDFVTQAAGKPLLLIFLHDLTRPSAGLTRALAGYAQSRAKDGLHCGVVWLTADKSAAEQYLKNARKSLDIKAPVAVSADGIEGPGSYGLNRNVALTVLVVNEGRVTANFALVQPAMTDAPKILAAAVKHIGGEPPTLASLQPPGAAMAPDARYRELMQGVIKRDAKPEEVANAAAAVEEYVKDDKDRQLMLGSAAKRIVDGGKLGNYGTPPAQALLKKWAEQYGPKEPK